MPVIRKKLEPESSQHQKLVRALVAELQRNEPTGAGPRIEEEEQRGNHIHVMVIWDAWNEIGAEERGRIIMDAYEKARPEDILRITVALGLTGAEAEKLMIGAEQYEISSLPRKQAVVAEKRAGYGMDKRGHRG